MKNLYLLLIVFALLLSGCTTQADIEKAYAEGYRAGYSDGEKLSVTEHKKGYDLGYRDGKADASAESSPVVGAPQPKSNTSAADPSGVSNYVLNTNTKKFHYPYCSSVNDMAEKNKLFFSGTRDEAIAMGYIPCKRCNP